MCLEYLQNLEVLNIIKCSKVDFLCGFSYICQKKLIFILEITFENNPSTWTQLARVEEGVLPQLSRSFGLFFTDVSCEIQQ